MTDIFIPELSENIHSGIVTKVSVKTGDTVAKGQTLFELETDKAVLEVPASSAGIVSEVLIKTGEKVKTGQLAFRFDGADAAPAPKPPAEKAAARPAATTADAAVKTAPVTAAVPAAPVAAAPQAPASANADVAASPSVRRFARELGVNIAEVPPSGPNQKISIDDVTAYAKKLITTRPAAGSNTGIQAPPLPDFTKWGDVKREGLSMIGQKTAEHMAVCWATIPHVTQFAKADITEVDKLRQKKSTDSLKLTITPFVIKVIAAALKHFPNFNASIDTTTKEIVYKKYYNIGIAVDTEYGLLVPVIKNADQKSILELAQEMKVLADKARTRKLTMDDMQGGTFTITNLGGITSGHFTPIVNAPESAILGLSRAQLEPCYNHGPVCAPRLMLPLSLSYDHRIINGADGARFTKWISDAIEQPLMLEL